MKKMSALTIASIMMLTGITGISANAESHIDFEGETVHITSDDLGGKSGEVAFSVYGYSYDVQGTDYYSVEVNSVYTILHVEPSDNLEITLTPTGKFKEGMEINVFGNYFVRPDGFSADTYRGDINIDGKKNIADAVCLYKYIMNRLEFRGMHWCRADLNGDGAVDIFDMAEMRKVVTENVSL